MSEADKVLGELRSEIDDIDAQLIELRKVRKG